MKPLLKICLAGFFASLLFVSSCYVEVSGDSHYHHHHYHPWHNEHEVIIEKR
jgi:hypothetical protein